MKRPTAPEFQEFWHFARNNGLPYKCHLPVHLAYTEELKACATALEQHAVGRWLKSSAHYSSALGRFQKKALFRQATPDDRVCLQACFLAHCGCALGEVLAQDPTLHSALSPADARSAREHIQALLGLIQRGASFVDAERTWRLYWELYDLYADLHESMQAHLPRRHDKTFLPRIFASNLALRFIGSFLEPLPAIVGDLAHLILPGGLPDHAIKTAVQNTKARYERASGVLRPPLKRPTARKVE
jgi:hypothetical protein